MKKMYKPSSMFLAPTPEYQGQYATDYAIAIYSNETEKGFKVNFKPATADDFKPLLSQTLTGIFALDGLCLELDGFEYNGKSDFYVVFTSGEADDRLSFEQDDLSHQVVIALGNDAPCILAGNQKIELDGAFKRENLVKKPISFEWKGNRLCVCTAYVTFEKEIELPCEFNKDAVRMMIAASDIDCDFSIECVGFSAALPEKVQTFVDAIDALDNATKEEIDGLYKTYNNFELCEKLSVFNFAKLSNARTALRKIDENGFDDDGFYVPGMKDTNYKDTSVYKGCVAREAKHGGIQIDFHNGGFGMRQYVRQRFIAEDITVRLENLNRTSGGLIIGLTSEASDGDTWNLMGITARFGMFFQLGTDSTIFVTKPFDESKKMLPLISDPLLCADNLQNKEILFNFKYEAETKAITVSFTIDGKTLTKELNDFGINLLDNRQRIFSQSLDFFNYEKAQVIIQTTGERHPLAIPCKRPDRRSAMQVDLTGIKFNKFSKAQQKQIDERISAIDALPDVATLELEEKINEVWQQCFTLKNKKKRAGVTNFDKLIKLHDEIFALKMNGKKAYHYEGERFVPVGKIDNSALTTRYKPHSEVKFDSKGIWPEWTKDCVVATCRIETATPEGTFMAMEPVLRHFAELGVSVLWLTPIEDVGIGKIRSTYCNYGPHTICPYLTGQLKKGEPYDASKVDYEAGWKVFAEFLDMAHKYNIRVLIDKVPWGLANEAPLTAANPHWFKGASGWGGQDYHLDNPEVIDYYKNAIVKSILDTNCDGIRWDLEPNYFGYDLVEQMRDELVANGMKPLFISEDQAMHGKAYAYEQFSVVGEGVSSQLTNSVFFEQSDIVNAVKNGNNIGSKPHPKGSTTNGTGKYYTYQVSSHDCLRYRSASLADWAYEFILGSFIPLFYLGEEWGTKVKTGVYGAKIGWDELKDKHHSDYLETVKKLMQIRWTYKDIINCDADDHRNTNICRVDTIGAGLVRGYARYKDNKAILVIPNVNETSDTTATVTAEIPFEEMGLCGYTTYTLTDLMTDKEVVSGTADEIKYFSREMEHDTCEVYLLTAQK